MDKIKAQKEKSEKKIVNKLINKKLGVDNRNALDILRRASQRTGVPVDFLAANAFQEGMFEAIRTQNAEYGSDEFPVSGYIHYGMDTFGSNADRLKKKGYIPNELEYQDDFNQSEKGEDVQSANFRTNEDALVAKAAFLKDFRDSVVDYSNKKKLKLEPKTEQYLTMAAYNGGIGNAMKMIDELSKGVSQKDFVEKGLTSRKGVHKNIAPRMDKMALFRQIATGPAPLPKRELPDEPSLFNLIYRR